MNCFLIDPHLFAIHQNQTLKTKKPPTPKHCRSSNNLASLKCSEVLMPQTPFVLLPISVKCQHTSYPFCSCDLELLQLMQTWKEPVFQIVQTTNTEERLLFNTCLCKMTDCWFKFSWAKITVYWSVGPSWKLECSLPWIRCTRSLFHFCWRKMVSSVLIIC